MVVFSSTAQELTVHKYCKPINNVYLIKKFSISYVARGTFAQKRPAVTYHHLLFKPTSENNKRE
ncbi:hypothetical protein [Niabella digestorum]|uniref:hypothetical protein n=1 Tax=Niabella digestorum TaxID=3117701 RepID=UPI002ED8053F